MPHTLTRIRTWSTTVLVIGLLSLAALAIVEAQQSRAQTPTLTPQDYIEIQQLVNKYAFALDTCSNNGYDYAELYTSDGIFEWGVGNRRSIGRDQLAEAAGGGKNGCKKLKDATPEKPIPHHVTVNLVIEPSPEGAVGKSYLVYPGELGITADPTHTGHVGGYQDVYVKTTKGWRFRYRVHVFPPLVPGAVKVSY